MLPGPDMNKPLASALLGLAGLALAGCLAPDDVSELEAVEQDSRDCSIYVCGNSPEVAHYGLWEASLYGVRDQNQISLATYNGAAAIWKNGVPYRLSVYRGRLSGSTKFSGISGQGLVGSTIEVLKGGLPYYTIHIAGVRTTGVSFVVGVPEPVEVYTMQWTTPTATVASRQPLCNSVLAGTYDEKLNELLGMYPTETLVFEGDRFDAVRKTVSATADDTWFNFGCAGHTLAKLYLTRNTIHTQTQPEWRIRQAMLKMYTGDYCGTGDEFTLAGEPIAWKGGVLADYPSYVHPTTLDARWDETGAVCLGDELRMESSTNPQAPTEFPDVRAQVKETCPDRANLCANLDPFVFDAGRVISANRELN